MADDKKSGPSGASVDHKKFQTLKTQAEQQAKDVSQAIGYMHSYLFVCLISQLDYEECLENYSNVLEYEKKIYGATGSEVSYTSLKLPKCLYKYLLFIYASLPKPASRCVR